MSGLFAECSSLKSLPDISKWNIKNVKYLGGAYLDISSLPLTDIEFWNNINNNEMINGGIFAKCSSLESLPDISKWNTNNVTNMCGIFAKCSSLKSLPDI